jgi:ketosteroid isomerase-like protein
MISGNEAELRAVSSEKLSYGHSGGLVENQQQFVEKFKTGASDFVTIELKNQTITISGNTAIVRHELHATTNDNNKPGEVHLRVMLVFQKQAKEWKLLGRQAVKITP